MENISLMTYCSSQSIWWVQAICLQYWICKRKILPQFCIYLSELSLYGCWFIFYHILGIFAVQVILDAFVLYVAITLRIRNWVNWLQNFHYWRSWTWQFLHCQKNLWKLWGAVVLLKSLKWNQLWDGRPHIHIEGDEEFDDDGEALAIAKNMPELRHLQLIGNKVTNDGLQAILDGCPHLESLDIRKCFNVTLSGNLGKRCAERIKNLRHPNDSTHDYGFMAEISDMDRFHEDDSGDFYFDY